MAVDRKERKLPDNDTRQAYRALFGTSQRDPNSSAAIVLGDLADFCRLDGQTFVSQDEAGRHSAFNEGMRRVALRVFHFLNDNVDGRITLVEKQRERRNAGRN